MIIWRNPCVHRIPVQTKPIKKHFCAPVSCVAVIIFLVVIYMYIDIKTSRVCVWCSRVMLLTARAHE